MIVKRFFDLMLSIVGLIVASPLLLIIAILVKLNLGSPIIFTQERVGKGNTKFKMYKFRTMKDAVDKDGNQLPDEERLTKFGRRLRNLSFDELPELVNIIKGDMSIVGPRPLLVQYLSLYNGHQIKRHNVLPGLTGWAQVNGRNSISFKEKFDLDVWYVENWSLLLDIKIFFLTFGKVIKRDGINKKGQATTEYFNGNN